MEEGREKKKKRRKEEIQRNLNSDEERRRGDKNSSLINLKNSSHCKTVMHLSDSHVTVSNKQY